MSKAFRAYNLDQQLLLPPSLHDWLPEGHLAPDSFPDTDNGILLKDAHFNEVVQNFSHNNGDSGVLLIDSSRNTIRRNRFVANAVPGPPPPPFAGPWTGRGGCDILLGGSNNNAVLENEIADGHWGMRVFGDGNLFARNYVRGNVRAGIHLGGTSTGNLVLENNFAGNGLGNLEPSMRFDMFDDSTGGNAWVRNKGTANFTPSN